MVHSLSYDYAEDTCLQSIQRITVLTQKITSVGWHFPIFLLKAHTELLTIRHDECYQMQSNVNKPLFKFSPCSLGLFNLEKKVLVKLCNIWSHFSPLLLSSYLKFCCLFLQWGKQNIFFSLNNPNVGGIENMYSTTSKHKSP